MDRTRLPNGICAVYEHMDKNKILLKDTEQLIWRGFGLDIAKALNLRVGSIYNIIGQLVDLGCITRLRHGGINTPSVYAIIKEPDGYQYTLQKEQAVMFDRVRMPTQYERTQDAITRLTNRVTELERRLGAITEDGLAKRRDDAPGLQTRVNPTLE